MYHGFSVCASVFSCIRFQDRGLAVWEPRTKYRLVSYKILPPPPSSPIQHLSLTGRTTPPPPDQSPSVASRPGIGVPGDWSGLLETEPLPSNNARTRGCSRCVVKATSFSDRSSCDPIYPPNEDVELSFPNFTVALRRRSLLVLMVVTLHTEDMLNFRLSSAACFPLLCE
jgi:hypothetical protein